MRNIALVLLLSNLLLLAWQRWVVPPEQPRGRLELSQDYSDLVYMPRPGSTPAADDPILGTTPLTPDSRVRCLRIGPFGRESDALRVRDGLEGGGVAVQQTSEQGDIWVGHWVTVKGLETRENARKALASLAANGMQDAYIVSEGAPTISLGVFRKRASVDIVAGKARALGFVVETTDRLRPGTNYWLDTQLTGTQALPLRLILQDMGQILRSETIACPEPA